MQAQEILIVGYGKLGSRVGQNLSKKAKVTALKRSPIEPSNKISMCFADVTQIENLNEALQLSVNNGVDYLIYCLSPSERSEQSYRDAYLTGLKNVISTLPRPERLKHILFISSTSVYHQSQGEQVDELSPCEPINYSGKILLEAETYLASLVVPSTCIRFSGIYGGSRSRLIDQVKQALINQESLTASPSFTNRIHEDDCVGFICHLVRLLDEGKTIEPCYVASDSCPVSQAEVYNYISDQLSQTETNHKDEKVTVIESETSSVPRRAGSKRCVNKRMLVSGYTLKFESYQEGYKQKF